MKQVDTDCFWDYKPSYGHLATRRKHGEKDQKQGLTLVEGITTVTILMHSIQYTVYNKSFRQYIIKLFYMLRPLGHLQGV
jgi:hypothetical protein